MVDDSKDSQGVFAAGVALFGAFLDLFQKGVDPYSNQNKYFTT